MNTTERTNVLLTGAGFTKNFGGFLASEFHTLIFNDARIQNSPRLREVVLANPDFESLYQDILDGDYTPEEKTTIHDAVFGGYRSLDSAIRMIGFESDARKPVGKRYTALLDVFLGNRDKTGYVFTLNQDLFLERCYWDHSGPVPLLPGIEHRELWFSTRFAEPLVDTERVVLPNRQEVDSMRQTFPSPGRSYLIKLHGSCNWIDNEGEERMIIGGLKSDRIAAVPLLRWYFNIFQEVLHRPNAHLLLIGYGFGDQHINDVIAECIVNTGLSLYVLGPSSLAGFTKKLTDINEGRDLLSGLRGYFPYSLVEVFPADENAPPTQPWLDIMQTAFGFDIDERFR
ncbi:SIR2 family protein [Candidatus Bipolaricaulota bacterium]